MISSNLLRCKILYKILKNSGVALLLFIIWGTPATAAQKLGEAAGANNHPHNLSSLNTGGIGTINSLVVDQICIFCHTPHNSSADGPLWNRADPLGPNGDGSFPLYGRLADIAIDDPASGSLYGVVYPNGASRLCLSCHDGVTAMGTVVSGGNIDPAFGSMSAEGSLIGTIDLSTSHPISFVYNDGVRVFIEADQGVPLDSYIVPAAALGYLDSESRMQCTTCHDPHLDTRVTGYDLPMWRDNQTGVENTDYEKTCDACHQGGSQSAGLDIKPAFGSGAGQGVHPIALP